jgi:hypothetical protein
VPEFANGTLKLQGCKIKRLVLSDASGRWAGAYHVAVEDPATSQKRTVVLDGVLTAPRLRVPNADTPPPPAAFGA